MPEVRSALIVATNEYDDSGLRRLRAPANDAAELAEQLENPAVGGFAVRILQDRPHYEIAEQVETFFADRNKDDLLLLFFACHGLKDDAGNLFLAAKNTRLNTLNATSIPAGFVRGRMEQSMSKRILLVLDCCYSGAFHRRPDHRGPDAVDVVERFDGEGRAVITASTAMEYAFEGGEGLEQYSDSVGTSIFTTQLVAGLRTGEADNDGDTYITVDELYEFVYTRVRELTKNQTPTISMSDVQGRLTIARAPLRRPDNSRPDPNPFDVTVKSLEQAISHPLTWVRVGAIDELGRLLRAKDQAAARWAELQLRELVDDDSRRVSQAAKVALADPETLEPVLPEPDDEAPSRAPYRDVMVSELVHAGEVNAVAFSPDGRFLATAGDDRMARVWDLATGGEVVTLPHTSEVTAATFSLDGRYLATRAYDKRARLWDLASAQEVAGIDHEQRPSTIYGSAAIAVSADGRLLATGSNDGTARVWEVASGNEVARVSHRRAVNSVAFTRDGRRLATGSDDGTARVWDLAAGRELRIMAHEDKVLAVAFSYDGHYLATGCEDKRARIWETETGREMMRLPHDGEVTAVAFSPDGRRLATGSTDRVARVWDLGRGREQSRMTHDRSLKAVAFSPDGLRLATASGDYAARLWSVPVGAIQD